MMRLVAAAVLTLRCPGGKKRQFGMSERRYYEDAYTASFQAKIIETVIENNRFGLVLAETYFYPASGGQPADGGTINGRPPHRDHHSPNRRGHHPLAGGTGRRSGGNGNGRYRLAASF
ncbi:MAG: hypothetical protein M5U34_32450 [Chloroflexi bacterium]|nr:hypothetical protein [Chloroflexota bacterium]